MSPEQQPAAPAQARDNGACVDRRTSGLGRCQRGRLLPPDNRATQHIERLRQECESKHPGVFDVDADRVRCNACDVIVTSTPARCNSYNVCQHFETNKVCIAGRKRKRNSIQTFFPPGRVDHEAEAKRCRRLLNDPRRVCHGYHHPTVTHQPNDYVEPIELPISLLWENGRSHEGEDRRRAWHTVSAQRIQFATGRTIDGEVELVEHCGTIRSTNQCEQLAVRANGEPDGTNCCYNCLKAATNADMQQRLVSLSKKPTVPHAKTNNRYYGDKGKSSKLKAFSRETKQLKQANKVLIRQNIKLRSRLEEFDHAVDKGSVGHVLHSVRMIRKYATDTDDVADATAVLERVQDTLDYHARHMQDKATGSHLVNGHRTSAATKALGSALLIRYGSSAVSFLTDNGGLGVSTSTARKTMAKLTPFVVGHAAPAENFATANVEYEKIRQRLISSGDMVATDVVAFELSEDETPIPAEPCIVKVPMRASRIRDGDGALGDTELAVAGICGRRDANHKCQLGHCRYLHPKPLETIIDCCVNEVAGGYLSAMMLNPLDPRFPARAVVLDCCCNRFDSTPHCEARWQEARKSFKAEMNKSFVLCGHASDGDARRFLLQLHECRLLAAEQHAGGQRTRPDVALQGVGPTRREYIGLTCPSFPTDLRAAIDWQGEGVGAVIVGIRGINNQDPIHNCKKGDAPLRSAAKTIKLGQYTVGAEQLNLLKTNLKGLRALGGISAAAIKRADRQNFKQVAERQSLKVTKNLRTLESGGYASTLGLAIVYECLREFMLIWFSETRSLKERIESAGYVCGLLTRLKLRVSKTEGLNVTNDFWPNQSYRHIMWGCLTAVWIALLHSRQNKGKKRGDESVCALHLTGSDCLERFFANLGGFGKYASWQRNFNFFEAVHSTGRINHFQGLQHGEGSVKVRKAHHKQECPVHLLEDQPQKKVPHRNLQTPFTDEEYAAAFQGGADRARTTLQGVVGMDNVMTKDANVRIDIPDTYDAKGSTDGATKTSMASAFGDLLNSQVDADVAENAADRSAPAPKVPRSSDTAAAETAAHSGTYRRVLPEADMIALDDPSQYTDGYLPMSAARELKAAPITGAFDRFAEVADKHVSAGVVSGWTGKQKFGGPCGLGYVATGGNCAYEAFAVGLHVNLMAERGGGVALNRDSISTGIGFVDADMHFDPVPNPYGPDSPGRVFKQAVDHARRKMAAHVLADGWWPANQVVAQAYYGNDKAPNPGQDGHRTVTLDDVLEAVSTDRAWAGELELNILADAFGCALVVHDYRDGSIKQRAPPYGDPSGPLIQLVFNAGESHYYCVCGSGEVGYEQAVAATGKAANVATAGETEEAEMTEATEETLGQQLQGELTALMADSLAWDKAGSGAAGKDSGMLIDVGGGKMGYARTVLRKIWQRALEMRGCSETLSKDRLSKIAQNSQTTASASTVAPAVGIDFSGDVLGMYTDVAMGFEKTIPGKKGSPATKEYQLYIGQVDKMLTTTGGTRTLHEESVSFNDVPDNLRMRCTWYKEGAKLPNGDVTFTLGVAGGGDDDSNYSDKQSLLGAARLECFKQPAGRGEMNVVKGKFVMDKVQYEELQERLTSMKPTVQAETKRAAKRAASKARAATQSVSPYERPYTTTRIGRAARKQR